MSQPRLENTPPDRFFKEGDLEILARSEPGHFWFEARRALIVSILGLQFPTARDYLEVGTGTGFLLESIAGAFPSWRLNGSDLDSRALAHVSSRVPAARLFLMDARFPPLRSPATNTDPASAPDSGPELFDVIGAYDVIEHIEDDATVLQQFSGLLRSGGGLVLTVPQHRWLWSSLDEYSRHCRRYTRAELVQKVEDSGFRVERVTSFATLTLPLMMLSRWLKPGRVEDCDPTTEVEIGRLTNAILNLVMRLEGQLIRWRLPMPVGGSLLLVARRP